MAGGGRAVGARQNNASVMVASQHRRAKVDTTFCRGYSEIGTITYIDSPEVENLEFGH